MRGYAGGEPMLVFGVVLIGLGLALMLTPGPGAMFLFPGVVLVIAALVLLLAGGRREVPSRRAERGRSGRGVCGAA